MRLRIDLAYDGTHFHGWAAQDGLRTVQGELELWITRVLRLSVPAQLTVAGRTDAGVHARGQVAHLDVEPAQIGVTPLDVENPIAVAAHLTYRLARALPPDLVVYRVTDVSPAFDARFAALWRRYQYRLTDQRLDPLLRHQLVQVRESLDVAAMDEAATRLVGLHDFAALCKRREGATTIRTVLDCRVERHAEGSWADTISVHIRADAFCHSMVRSVVGALVAVGEGRFEPSWIDALLQRRERAGEVTVMPAHGLVLEEVGYPDEDGLAARVRQARARRELPTFDQGADD